MSASFEMTKLRSLTALAALAIVLAFSFLAHRPAFTAGYYYDDEHTLGGLASVSSPGSAWEYIQSGDTGPAGRPLSLASFVLNAPSWPDAPEDFHYTNTLIHLINGLLLFWLAWLISQQLHRPASQPEWVALVACGLWLIHPLWVSTIHLPVQRMTELAATFSLAGLVGYLKTRSHLSRFPVAALAGMNASLLLGGALAVLSKENGILLPVYALAIEWILAKPALGRFEQPWRYWKALALYLPILLIVGYMAKLVLPYAESAYAARNFDLFERVLTQPRVLWNYVQLLALPRSSAITLFGDDYPISTGWVEPMTTLWAAAAWLSVAIAAAVWHKKFPLFAASVLWFLGGHLLESTIVPLEIYFEHRNYLPTIGPIMFLTFGIGAWLSKTRINGIYIACAYGALLLFVLYQTTSAWGNPYIASKLALDLHPLSARAAQNRAATLYRMGEKNESVRVIQDARQRMPWDTALALQALGLGCADLDPKQTDDFVASIDSTLRHGVRTTASLDALRQMTEGLDKGSCPNITPAHIHRMLDGLMSNKRYIVSNDYMSNLHELKAHLFLRERDFNNTMIHYERAIELEHRLDLALLIPPLFLSAGLPELALQRIDQYLDMQPKKGITEKRWRDELNAQRHMIENALSAQAAIKGQQPTRP